MYPSVWTPHMTVAAVIEHDQRYLVVEEMADGRRVFNQPAGHLEPGERLADAVVREVLEETGVHFEPEHLIGIYRWVNPRNDETHVRIAFTGSVTAIDPGRPLDTPIIAAHWLSYDDLRERSDRLRSPLVLGCLEDHRRGRQYPIEMLRDFG